MADGSPVHCRNPPALQDVINEAARSRQLEQVVAPEMPRSFSSSHLQSQWNRVGEKTTIRAGNLKNKSKQRVDELSSDGMMSTQASFLCNICVVFKALFTFGNSRFIHASTNATDDHKYSPFPSQILTVQKFWYHLAHSFSRTNGPFGFGRAPSASECAK